MTPIIISTHSNFYFNILYKYMYILYSLAHILLKLKYQVSILIIKYLSYMLTKNN